MTFLWTVEYTPDTARYTPVVERMSDWVYSDKKHLWDSLEYWLPQGRDFMKKLSNNNVPLIMEGSWQDKFFNASGILNASKLNNNSHVFLYIGAVQGHGGDHSPTEDIWHMQFFNDWFFHWLFGGTTVLPKKDFDFAYTNYPANGIYWTFIHDSTMIHPSELTTPYRLYFNTNNRLTTTANTSNNTRVSVRNQVSGGLTIQEAVNEEFTGTVFNSKFKKNSRTFTSTVLRSDMKWLGTPKINLDYLSSANTFAQYNFQVYEVLPGGTEKLINRLNYTDRNYVSNSRRTKNFEGQAHAHIFKAGNRIRLKLTNLDTSPDDNWFLGTNPFVLPVLNNGYNYIYLNNKSYIDLPVMGITTSQGDEIEPGSENPLVFSLSQNYPNPFNPSTSISFELSSKNFVSVKVFDILGKEVGTIVNEIKDAGRYSVIFDGSKLSSGVYFYRINSGTFSDVKRMVLVK
jgi:predicted acyl esterase